jgi:hypothetical protein
VSTSVSARGNSRIALCGWCGGGFERKEKHTKDKTESDERLARSQRPLGEDVPGIDQSHTSLSPLDNSNPSRVSAPALTPHFNLFKN